jgi:AcrR family transcriptional regulator
MRKSVKRRGRPLASADATDVRNRLLDAVERLTYESGIRAVGIDRILEEASAAKASLYAHFSSKDALVAAALERRACAAQQAVTARVDGAGADPIARLFALLDASASFASEAGFRGCPFQLADAELTDAEHPASVVTQRQLQWMQDLIRDLVRRARPNASSSLAGAIIALHEGAVAQASRGGATAALLDARWATQQLLTASTC